MAHVLVFDLGTSYLKAVVFDEQEQIVALYRAAVEVDRPHPGWAEVPVERFRVMVADAVKALGESVGRVGFVTFATQSNTFVMLDEHDQPLTPFIVWNDGRAELQDVPPLLQLSGFRDRTGVPALSPQFMVAKLRWFARTQPGLWRRVARVALLSDYLTWWLTGQWVTEAGAAGLTGLLDIRTLTWWPDACTLSGINVNALPGPVRAGTSLGSAQSLGLPTGCRVIVGCLDQYAGAIGVADRHITPGTMVETTGTVLATVRCVRDIPLHLPDGVFAGPGHTPGINYLMCFGSTSANLLEHFRSTLPDRPSFVELDRLAADATTDLVIEPVVEGGRIEDCFCHVQPQHTRGQITRAILEAVARALVGQARLLCGDERPAQIIAAGGGARSRLWLDIKSRTLAIPIVACPCPEPTSLGAARLIATADWTADEAGS